MQNRRGKVVSKKASAQGKRRFDGIEPWLDSLMEARKALHINGFVAVNGKTLQGKALYVKAKTLWKARSDGAAALGASLSSITSPVKGGLVSYTAALASIASPARQRLSQ